MSVVACALHEWRMLYTYTMVRQDYNNSTLFRPLLKTALQHRLNVWNRRLGRVSALKRVRRSLSTLFKRSAVGTDQCIPSCPGSVPSFFIVPILYYNIMFWRFLKKGNTKICHLKCLMFIETPISYTITKQPKYTVW